MTDVQIDQARVMAAMEARYQRMVAELVRENAHLEAYIAQLTATQPPADPWGHDPATDPDRKDT